MGGRKITLLIIKTGVYILVFMFSTGIKHSLLQSLVVTLHSSDANLTLLDPNSVPLFIFST